MKKFVLFAVALGGAVLVTQPLMAQETIAARPLAQQKTFRVAIDAGRGGKDKGDVVGGVAAKDVNLKLALKLKSELEARGIQVVMTRIDDSFLTLQDRTDFVEKQHVNCFVALRANDNSRFPKMPRCEVNYQRPTSALLANFLNSSLSNAPKSAVNKPLTKLAALNYFVLRKVSAPAAMVSGDLTLLNNSKEQNKLIQLIADGIANFSEVEGLNQQI